jgi:ectoine hydroxylase-related dioxygenase (phytanoyl-CoA dioxygenase family)
VRISDDTLSHLDTHGYAIVPDFLSRDELAAARLNVFQYFPQVHELWAAPQRFPHIFDDPEHLQIEFPFAGQTLNDLATHSDLIDFVERALGVREVLLTQAAIWAKYSGTGDFGQEMHLDYQGNTLVVPRDDGPFRQINMILYYTDVSADLGATRVVSRTKTRDLSPWPPFRPKKKWPKLHADEVAIEVKAGSLFIFQMGTFHRAGEMTDEPGRARFSQHLVWRAAAHSFAGYHLWSRFGERDELERFIERTTPRQREVLGFPPPGHPYWNEQTLAGVAARYPGMDLAPYRRK